MTGTLVFSDDEAEVVKEALRTMAGWTGCTEEERATAARILATMTTDPASVPTLDPATCEHLDFAVNVGVGRVTEEEGGPVAGYAAEVRVNCAQCGTPAVFHCPDFGLLAGRPTISVDGQELRAPLRMATDPDDFGLQLPGFTVRAIVPLSDN